MNSRLGRILVAVPPAVWMLGFFLVPFLIVFKISFAEVVLARPPFTPLFEVVDGAWTVLARTANYALLLQDDLYLRAFVNSLRIAAISTAIALAIGLPLAYAIVRAPGRLRTALVILAILPFWSSSLIRVYAWIAILKPEGLLNLALESLGLIAQPLVLLNTETAVFIGIVYAYLPFMVLPIYASLERIDPALLEAAADLGARPTKAFWTVTVPLAWPGILAGCLLVFIPAVGEFVIPDLLGGSDTLMIGRTLWVEFFNNRDWPLASAVAIVLLLVLLLPILLFQWQQGRMLEDR